MVSGRISPSTPRAGWRPERAAGLLVGLLGAGAPRAALAQSGEQLHAFILQYSWCSLGATGLLYAGLSFAVARGQSWRWATSCVELALVLAGTWGTFAPDPAGVAAYYWQFVVFVLQACVLGGSLLRARQRPWLWAFVIFGWWLVPILLLYPGMFTLGPALPWLQTAGAALRS